MSKRELLGGLKRSLVTLLSAATIITSIPGTGVYASEITPENETVVEDVVETSSLDVETESVTEIIEEVSEPDVITESENVVTEEEMTVTEATTETEMTTETEITSEEIELQAVSGSFYMDCSQLPEGYTVEVESASKETEDSLDKYTFDNPNDSYQCISISVDTKYEFEAIKNGENTIEPLSNSSSIYKNKTNIFYNRVELYFDRNDIVNRTLTPIFKEAAPVYNYSIDNSVLDSLIDADITRNGVSCIDDNKSNDNDCVIPAWKGDIIEITYSSSSKYDCLVAGINEYYNVVSKYDDNRKKYSLKLSCEAYLANEEKMSVTITGVKIPTYNVTFSDKSLLTVTSGNKPYTFDVEKYIYLMPSYSKPLWGKKATDNSGITFDKSTVAPGDKYKLYVSLPGIKVSGARINGETVEPEYGVYSVVDLSEYTSGDVNIELDFVQESLKELTFSISGDVSSASLYIGDGCYNIYEEGLTYKTYANELLLSIEGFDYWTVFPDEINVTVTVDNKKVEPDEYGGYPITDFKSGSVINVEGIFDSLESGKFTLGEELKNSCISYSVKGSDGNELACDDSGKYILDGNRYIDFEFITNGNNALYNVEMFTEDESEGANVNRSVIHMGMTADDTDIANTVRIKADKLVDTTVDINDECRSSRVVQIITPDDVDISVSNGSRNLNLVKGNPWYDTGVRYLNLGYGDDAIITVNPGPGYKVKGITVCGDGMDKRFSGNTVTINKSYAVDTYSYIDIEVDIERIYYLRIAGEEGDITGANPVIKPNSPYSLYLATSGESENVIKAAIMNGRTEVAVVENPDEKDGEYYINYNCNDEKIWGKKLSAEFTVEKDGKTVVYKYPFTVGAGLTSIKLNGKEGVNNIIKQQTASDVVYKLSFNAGVNPDKVELTSNSALGMTAEYAVDPVDGPQLTVKSMPYDNESEYVYDDDAEIEFTYCGITKKVNFSFSGDAIIKTAPTVKLYAATDRAFQFDVTFPKGVVHGDKMYYRVVLTAVDDEDKLPEGYKKTVTVDYAGASGATGRTPFTYVVDQDIVKDGEGTAVKYNAEVYLVCGTGFTYHQARNVAISSKPAELKNISTNSPAYATKFTLSKRNTTLYANNNSWVPVGYAEFDKSVTYRKMTGAYVIPDDGHVTAQIIENSVSVKTDEDALGKYTVIATAEGASVPVTASLAITVKANIDPASVTLTVPSNSVYKKKNTALTIKPTLAAYDFAGKTLKPKSVVYSVDSSSSESIIDAVNQGLISINDKTGVVSVKKNYNVSDYNRLVIKATYTDYNDVVNEVITGMNFTSVADEIAYLEVVRGDDNPEVIDVSAPVTTDVLGGGVRIRALNSRKQPISDLTFTASGKSVAVDKLSGMITATEKVGKTKITVATNDGGKNKKDITIETKYYVPESGVKLRYYSDVKGAFEDISTSTAMAIPGAVPCDIQFKDNSDDVWYSIYDPEAPVVKVTVTCNKSFIGNLNDDIMDTLYLTGQTASVTIKDAKGKTEYKFVDSRNVDKTPVKLKKSAATIYAMAAGRDESYNYQNIEFEVTNPDIVADIDYIDLTAVNTEYKNNNVNYTNVWSLYRDNISYDAGKLTLEEKYIGDYPSIPKGSYKFYVELNYTDGTVVSIPITIKVVDMPKPVFTVNSTYATKKADVSVPLVVKTMKNVMAFTGVSASPEDIYNYNDKGVVNEFSKYFEIINVGDSWSVSLKDGIEGVDSFEKVPAKDRTGYVTFVYSDLVGRECKQVVKITLNVK